MFFATRAVLKIGEYFQILPSFSWGIFDHVTRLDQSLASEIYVERLVSRLLATFVSSNTKIINFCQANTVQFVLRLGRNHCYQRQICYPRSGQKKFRLRRAYPKDYYEEYRI